MKLEWTAISPDRRHWAYSADETFDLQNGCVGHLRGDFGRSGDEFWTTFFDHRTELKSDDFRSELQKVVTGLTKKNALLCDFKTMRKLCRAGTQVEPDNFCLEAQTERYLYCLRCITQYGGYHFYLYAYDKQVIRENSAAAEGKEPTMSETPVYNETAQYAREHDELEAYRANHRLNEECARSIRKIVAANFDGMRLNRKAAHEAIEQCGAERLLYVLANTVQQKMYDGRFGRDVKEWAATVEVKPQSSAVYWVTETHPAVLDGFIRDVLATVRENG